MDELIKIVEESSHPQLCEYPDGTAGWENLKRVFVVTGCDSEEAALQANRIPQLDSKHEIKGAVVGRCVKLFCEPINGDRQRFRIVAIYESHSDLNGDLIVHSRKWRELRFLAMYGLAGILIAIIIWVFFKIR